MNELTQDYLEKHAKGIPWKPISNYLKKNEMAREMLLGGAGGAIATTAVMPIDTISDVQKQWRNTRNDPQLNQTSKSFLATAKEIAHPKIRENAQGGVAPFYAGASGKLLKVVPSMAITFAAKHKIQSALIK